MLFLLPTGFGESLIKHLGEDQIIKGQKQGNVALSI